MIQLIPNLPKLSHLKNIPTHAALIGAQLVTQPWQGGLMQLTLQYAYGTLDTNGRFLLDQHAFHTIVQLPDPPSSAGLTPPIDPTKVAPALANLMGAGIAPSRAGDPTALIVAAGKGWGDHNMSDMDAVVAALHPDLLGTVVATPAPPS